MATFSAPLLEQTYTTADVASQELEGRYLFSLSRFLLLAERPTTGG